MERFVASLGTLAFLLVAPGSVLLLVPVALTDLRMLPPLFGVAALRPVGAVLIAAGLWPMLDSFARFALEGLGTPAPVAPARRLVVTGFYRHVRNPMYVGLVLVMAGETLLLGQPVLFLRAAFFWICSPVFVVGFEEKRLARVFGAAYADYATTSRAGCRASSHGVRQPA